MHESWANLAMKTRDQADKLHSEASEHDEGFIGHWEFKASVTSSYNVPAKVQIASTKQTMSVRKMSVSLPRDPDILHAVVRVPQLPMSSPRHGSRGGTRDCLRLVVPQH